MHNMNRINTYIECYMQYVFHKHRSPNKYQDIDAYLDNEFKYVASNWDNEYDIVQWLGSNIKSLLTADTICTMIQTIQRYYGDDPCIKNIYLEITPELVMRHYCHCVIHEMPSIKIKELVQGL